MGKAMLFLVVIMVAGVGILLWLGLGVTAPTATSNGGFSPPTPVIPNLNLKEKAEAAGEKVATSVKTAAQDAGVLLKGLELKFGKERLEVQAGTRAGIAVMRKGGDTTKPLTLELTPAPGSGLVATGGEFKANEIETTVIVEAPTGSHDASVSVKGGDTVKLLPVFVK